MLAYLNREILLPDGWPPLSCAFEFPGGRPSHLPRSPGVYAFLVNDGRPLLYPKGESAIIYFGKASGGEGLRGRLMDHWRELTYRIEDDPQGQSHPYHTAYEWMAARGGLCVYSQAPARVGARSPAWVESVLIGRFRWVLRARPVANSMG